MLKPKEKQRDWFLFHMTPLGMGLAEERTPRMDASKKIALVFLGGVLAVGLLIAACLSL